MNDGSRFCNVYLRTNDPISLEIREQLIDILNQTLATTVDLKTQVKQAIWNAKSLGACHLHQVFDEIAMEMEVFVDLLAERVINLGGLARGTARTVVRHSILPEYPLHLTDSHEHVASVAERLAIYGTMLWDNIDRTASLGDADTAYLYAEVSGMIDKRLWFLDGHLMNSCFIENHQLRVGLETCPQKYN